MNDAEFEKQRARILAIAERWRGALGLGWWRITYEYHRGQIPNYPESIATCVARWKYLSAYIDFNLLKVADEDDEYLERIILHEYAHILLNACRPLDGFGDEELAREEMVASMLANTWLWTRDHFAAKANAA